MFRRFAQIINGDSIAREHLHDQTSPFKMGRLLRALSVWAPMTEGFGTMQTSHSTYVISELNLGWPGYQGQQFRSK